VLLADISIPGTNPIPGSRCMCPDILTLSSIGRGAIGSRGARESEPRLVRYDGHHGPELQATWHMAHHIWQSVCANKITSVTNMWIESVPSGHLQGLASPASGSLKPKQLFLFEYYQITINY
jgi:hypothetical protein